MLIGILIKTDWWEPTFKVCESFSYFFLFHAAQVFPIAGNSYLINDF